MKHYDKIFNLVKSVLSASATIKGRVYWAPQFGIEINTDNLNSLLSEHGIPKQYPLVLLMPPRGTQATRGRNKGWEDMRQTMFFLTSTYYQGTQVARRDPKTGTSQRPVTEDWDLMKKACDDFFTVLRKVHDEHRLFEQYFQLSSENVFTVPVSFVGVDRVSGVRADFRYRIVKACEVEDYDLHNLPNFNFQ